MTLKPHIHQSTDLNQQIPNYKVTKKSKKSRSITVSDRLRSGPCNKLRPEPEASCRLILSKLFSVSPTLCFHHNTKNTSKNNENYKILTEAEREKIDRPWKLRLQRPWQVDQIQANESENVVLVFVKLILIRCFVFCILLMIWCCFTKCGLLGLFHGLAVGTGLVTLTTIVCKILLFATNSYFYWDNFKFFIFIHIISPLEK